MQENPFNNLTQLQLLFSREDIWVHLWVQLGIGKLRFSLLSDTESGTRKSAIEIFSGAHSLNLWPRSVHEAVALQSLRMKANLVGACLFCRIIQDTREHHDVKRPGYSFERPGRRVFR